MLSYRHGFHAGNPADVLKHTILVFCLQYFKQKEKPFLYIDTHSGGGFYPLNSGSGAKNREWEWGIGRLPAPDTPLPAMLKNYQQLMSEDSCNYPGSPEISRKLLRAQDRAVCFELHPEDLRILNGLFRNDRRFVIRGEDGLAGLKSLLPPLHRRGLVLIDPSYEEKNDYTKVPEILTDALRRFPTGTYLIWYPLLLRHGASEQFPETLLELFPAGSRCKTELYTAPRNQPPENSPRGMYGSGMVILNPPWTLRGALEETLPVLAVRLGVGKDSWKLRWEAGG
jgi:23S rRNA (adenine2030-N6)-methyltransferase